MDVNRVILGGARRRLFQIALATGIAGAVAGSRGVAQTVASGQSSARAVAMPRVTIDVSRMTLTDAVALLVREAGLVSVYKTSALPVGRRVSLRISALPVDSAFRLLLKGSGLQASFPKPGYVLIASDASVRGLASGIITGRVIDAATKRGIAGVAVLLDDATKGVQSDADGAFRFVGVGAGSHKLRARRIGYLRAARDVRVADDATVTMEIAMESGSNVLDQVVITGTVIPTERRAVPNAMTVITAEQLEERGITRIDQLFRGDVPGLYAQDRGSANYSPGLVMMASRGGTSLGGALSQAIKTYVDGIELADPSYLGLIDPKSIERIEIITGPQASTIYGSNAINGVMQIFTKRGTSVRPQLTLTLQSGLIENSYSNARTPQHDFAAQLAGVESNVSYNVGASWNYTGPWSPSVHTTTSSGFGGVRLQRGKVSGDVSLRKTFGTNWAGASTDQAVQQARVSGRYAWSSGTGATVKTRYTGSGETVGITTTYAPWTWWSHTATVGSDASENTDIRTAAAYQYLGDTLLTVIRVDSRRNSLAYSTTLQAPLGNRIAATLTAGGDGWQSENGFSVASVTALSGSWNAPYGVTVSRTPSHNRGAFLQSQVALADRLFLTYGLRAEWNPNYGDDVNPNYSPRYGVAFTEEWNSFTMKARASYGRSTRPPTAGMAQQQTLADLGGYYATLIPRWGNVDVQVANPELLPEHQRGGEGGLELYLGNRASLVVTRYNQTVTNLISTPTVDSARALVPASTYGETVPAYWTDGYEYLNKSQSLNIGNIRNQGWETQGTVSFGPMTTKATYSWNKSRIIGVTPKYARQFATSFVVGSPFAYVPEHTYALNVRYAGRRASVSYDMRGQGRMLLSGPGGFSNNQLRLDVFSIRLRATDAPRMSLPSRYPTAAPGYAMGDVNAEYRFSPRVDGVLQILNANNFYHWSDIGPDFATIGRQTKIGVRARW